MNRDDDQERLLTEIRDTLREQLEEYRRVTAQSLEYQRRAVARQEQLGRLYQLALVACAALVALVIWYLGRLPLGR